VSKVLQKDGFFRKRDEGMFAKPQTTSPAPAPPAAHRVRRRSSDSIPAARKRAIGVRFFQGDLLWMGYKTTFIPYTRVKREIGRSQYTIAKRLKNSMDAILDSSYLPIRFISLFGVVTAFTGFVYALDIIYARLRHNIPYTGWAPIMVLLLVIGGVLMLMLGIIGEYVWRIYDEVKGKPNYVVRQIY